MNKWIKKRSVITNKKYQSSGYKKKMGKSMTLPDQNLSIAELLDRHSRGVSLGAPDLKGEYFDTEIPRFDDLTDMLEYKKNLVQQQIDLEEKIREEQALKQKKSEVVDSQEEKEAEPSEEKDPSK
tara:strand:- start:2027 stop:2401 length:375 start_codon:yes stop_codon:yes gene_type:complete